jgi:hypothetical protein
VALLVLVAILSSLVDHLLLCDERVSLLPSVVGSEAVHIVFVVFVVHVALVQHGLALIVLDAFSAVDVAIPDSSYSSHHL